MYLFLLKQDPSKQTGNRLDIASKAASLATSFPVSLSFFSSFHSLLKQSTEPITRYANFHVTITRYANFHVTILVTECDKGLFVLSLLAPVFEFGVTG